MAVITADFGRVRSGFSYGHAAAGDGQNAFAGNRLRPRIRKLLRGFCSSQSLDTTTLYFGYLAGRSSPSAWYSI